MRKRKTIVDQSIPQPKERIVPQTKQFTVKELRKVGVPRYQRWIVEANKIQLKESIDEVGLLRCPVIFLIKELKEHHIIDGNHIREIIIDKKNGYRDTDKISCIYQEVESEEAAAIAFKLLNTKGKNLDWVDITNLYMYISEKSNVYKTIWTVFGNPKSSKDILLPKGFSVPTIVEFLAGDKGKYRSGNGEYASPQIPRKQLLGHLMEFGNFHWDKTLGKESRRPTGAAIIGFANYWFKESHHTRHNDTDFLDMITSVYKKKSHELESGELVINRDNAGKLLHSYMESVNLVSID